MHPIYLMLGLCFCTWLTYWGWDEIEGDYAPVGFLAILLAFSLAVAVLSIYAKGLP